MASIWEILDVSGRRYAHTHPAARTRADSGGGPPAGLCGWVRTGANSSGSRAPGVGNCVAWTAFEPASSGTAVALATDWTQAGGPVEPWDASTLSCADSAPVWCASTAPTLQFFIGDDKR